MFFRTKTTRSGKALQLVESYRNREGKPRQRIVVSLGDLQVPEEHRKELARLLGDALYGVDQAYLIAPDTSTDMEKWVDYIVKRVEREGKWAPVKRGKVTAGTVEDVPPAEEAESQDVIDGVVSSRVSHTHTTSLGPVLAGLHFWEKLGMPKLLETLGFTELQRKAATALVLNRLDDPVSEHAMPEWLAGSSLPDLLGDDLRRKADDIFYRTGDRLLERRERIEAHLRRRQEKLFNLERTILLYDLTNTHFEGMCEANDKAAGGRNKQKRHDCPQVVVGMVFDEFGFELAHRTFKGNMSDSKSLIEMLESLHTVTSKDDLAAGHAPLVIMDSGVATTDNRRLLRDHGFKYLVNNTRPGRKKWAEDFRADDFTKVGTREGGTPVEVRTRDEVGAEKRPDGSVEKVAERLVFCRSAGRREKELAIRSRAEDRLLDELRKLRNRVESGRLKEPAKIQRAIGRKLQKNPRVARYYQVSLAGSDENRTVKWKRTEETWNGDSDLLGCYVLRTNHDELDAERLWTLYMTLAKAEEGFRMLKSDLGLRPNHHQLEERVDAHIFITVLAHQLLNAIIHTMSSTGDARSWPTLKRILQTHCYTTMLLPTIDGTLHRIRRAGTAEAEQQKIYETLGVDHRNLPSTKMSVPMKNSSIL
jgi:transposase